MILLTPLTSIAEGSGFFFWLVLLKSLLRSPLFIRLAALKRIASQQVD
jgi:hypothetical protein